MKLCVIGSYAKALVMTTHRIPLAGETLIGENFRGTFGGKGSDMAVQAARLNAQVEFMGVVGNDLYGDEFKKLLNTEKISQKGLRTSTDYPTGVGFIVKDDAGRNIITVDMGANKSFSKSDIDANIDLIKSSDVVLAQLEIPVETALYALKLAKKYGKITILNPAPATELINNDLSFVDYLTPNETEGQVVLGVVPNTNRKPVDIANDLLEGTGCKNIVMTLGGNGVVSKNKAGEIFVPAKKVYVVDSNGAGDCFNASLAVSLGNGLPLENAIIFSNACAGLCCTKWETVPSYHYLEDVENFMREVK
ncbi:MAG: ribokinase [Lachnospirales bacterium]